VLNLCDDCTGNAFPNTGHYDSDNRYCPSSEGIFAVHTPIKQPAHPRIKAKHFVGYSASEGGLKTATTHLGAHKLHDLYAPPFEAAVGDGELQSVIDFHSPVDDIPVAASRAILTDS